MVSVLALSRNLYTLSIAGVVSMIAITTVLLRVCLEPFYKILEQQKRFVGNLSHEIRTPLSTIMLGTEVALLAPDLTPASRKQFKSIEIEAERISEIINNRLTLSALSQPATISFEMIALSPLVKKVTRYYRRLAQERAVRIRVCIDTSCTMRGNTAAIEQMLMNLLKNALIYTPKHHRGIVTLRVHPVEDGQVRFSITDTGIGIAKEELPHILEPYYRSDVSRTRSMQHKSGLGLTIVREIVRVHQGKIHIQSSLGKGTVVNVYLPSAHTKPAASYSILPARELLQKMIRFRVLQRRS